MQGTLRLLETVRDHKLASGLLRGLFHIAIGRSLSTADGTPLANGVTWRELATLLKDAKFDKELVRELGADPDTLAPKDREKMWYHAIGLAKVDSAESRVQADKLARALKAVGLIVGPAPGGPSKLAELAPPPVERVEGGESPAETESEPPAPPGPKKKPKPRK